MSGYRAITLSTVLCATLLGACSMKPVVPQQTRQNEALARWDQCVARFSDAYSGPRHAVAQRANQHCEGYGRDVMATFPIHLENQIATLLSQRASAMTLASYVRTVGSEAWLESRGAQIDTLKTRLIEARQTDL